jgi:hypothetical protein
VNVARILYAIALCALTAYAQIPTPPTVPVSGNVQIAQFGAKGDGKTDDTQAFNAAVKAGGNIQLDAKTYLLTSAIQIPRSLSIIGTSKSTLLFRSPSPLNAGLLINGSSNISLSSFLLQGAGSSLTHGIDVVNAKNVHIDNLHIDGVHGTRKLATAGIFLGSDDGVWITNSTFTDIGTGSTKSSFAIWNYYGERSQHVYVDHNQFHNNSANIVVGLFDTENSIASNNVIDQGNVCVSPCKNNGYGILFYQMDHSKPTPIGDAAIDNKVTNTAGSGIYFASVNQVKITGNSISNSTQRMNDVSLPAAGIALNVVDTGEITGNTIQSDANGGICLATTKQISIHDNQIHDSGKWAIHLRVANVDTNISKNTTAGGKTNILVEHDAVGTRIAKPN